MKDCGFPTSTRRSSVQADWHAWLPQEKATVFHNFQQHLDSLYNMFSVALNEAIELRRNGFQSRSLSTLAVTADLCNLLSYPLAGMLRAFHAHSKHYGTVPNAAPLDPANYRGHLGQRSARMSGMLNRVLLSQRLQFLLKVTALQEMVEDLDKDFRAAAMDLADGVSIDPQRAWDELDANHYDLNTCLRETVVLFKSFLVVLPSSQLATFQAAVCERWQAPHHQVAIPQRSIQHGRIAAFAAE